MTVIFNNTAKPNHVDHRRESFPSMVGQAPSQVFLLRLKRATRCQDNVLAQSAPAQYCGANVHNKEKLILIYLMVREDFKLEHESYQHDNDSESESRL